MRLPIICLNCKNDTLKLEIFTDQFGFLVGFSWTCPKCGWKRVYRVIPDARVKIEEVKKRE